MVFGAFVCSSACVVITPEVMYMSIRNYLDGMADQNTKSLHFGKDLHHILETNFSQIFPNYQKHFLVKVCTLQVFSLC